MSDVLRYVEKYVSRYNRTYNLALEVYDAPIYEEHNGMFFIYFTTRAENFSPSCKRYHQIVIGELGIECYYADSNVIGISSNYPLSDVRLKFKNWCKHMLKKME